MPGRVLIVEDEQDVRDLLVLTLRNAGYQTITADSGPEALRKTANENPDLILLDIMLPSMSGTEICRRIRGEAATAGTPIIIVSAKTDEVDKILGLELGADDYVTKPFSPRELVLRVKKLLDRTRGDTGKSDRLAIGDLVVDRSRHQVTFRGSEIILTPTEFKLLSLLMERRGRVQTRDRLLTDVWDYEASIDTRTVDTHVRRLREKLGPASDYVETVRGVGYRLNGPAD